MSGLAEGRFVERWELEAIVTTAPPGFDLPGVHVRLHGGPYVVDVPLGAYLRLVRFARAWLTREGLQDRRLPEGDLARSDVVVAWLHVADRFPAPRGALSFPDGTAGRLSVPDRRGDLSLDPSSSNP